MLQSIRDHTHGWIAGTIVSLLILSFALWGIHSYLMSSENTSTVAKVNGVEISKSQLAVAYERLRRQLQTQYSSNYALPEGVEANLKSRALQTLVNIEILKQASLDQDYRISSRQVDGFLASIPDFQVNGEFSVARFQQMLATTLFTASDFLDLIKTSLLIDQPRLGVIFTSFSLPNEIENTVALVDQQRDIQYVILPLQDFLKQPAVISKDQINTYYKQHQDDFKTPEQVSIEYIELSVKDLMAALHPTDAELKKLYSENISTYTQPAQWRLAITLFNSGKHVEKTQDWMTLNQVSADLQSSVSKLVKPGQVTAPIETTQGLVLVKAIDFKDAKVQPFEQVKQKVAEAFIHQQAEEKFAEWREKLANTTYEHPDSLLPAAKAFNLPIKTSELFTKEKGGKDITTHTKVREAAFSNDVLNLQNNSDIIQLNADTALVLRIKSHMPVTLLSLQAVEKDITNKLIAIQADSRTAELANEIKKKLQAGENVNVTWNQAGLINRHATKIDSAILETAFAMPTPIANKVSYSTVKVPGGYAVIALKSVKNGIFSGDRSQYAAFGDQIQNAQGALEYELYKQSLINQAKIETLLPPSIN